MAARADGPANDESQAALRSIARPPLFSVDPRQIVPIPLHILVGITLRLLRLAIELVISCRGRPVGSAFAFELTETLRRVVRVRPAPYHAGVFIGRYCHAIAQRSDVICRALISLVAESDHVAHKWLWVVWREVSWTMNRAAQVHASEARELRANAQLFVRHLKRSFPWFNISPKLHILMYHAPDFLDLFGSIGLCGEQSIEAWQGFFTQNAAKYAAETEVGACANFVSAMAVAREVSDANLSTDVRTPAAEGARTAKKAGDRQRTENKGGSVECESTRKKAIQDGRKWAQNVFEEGDRTVEVFLTRLAAGVDR